MKNDYKILIGAIIVILIVLVGVYAFGGSNNPGPTATPTVAPTTNPTPTAAPGSEGGAMPTAMPTAVPTATPAPTPTPEPESGVKLTEFGYWITYPPLGPQNWSEYKPIPAPSPGPTGMVVSFENDTGYLGWSPDGSYHGFHDGYDTGEFGDAYVNITLIRSNPSGSITVNVAINNSNSDYPSYFLYTTFPRTVTFADGQSTALLPVKFQLDVDPNTYVTLELEPDTIGYTIGTPSDFTCHTPIYN